jgi:hypothetical protein
LYVTQVLIRRSGKRQLTRSSPPAERGAKAITAAPRKLFLDGRHWRVGLPTVFGARARPPINASGRPAPMAKLAAVQRVLIDLKNLAGDDKHASCQRFLVAFSESIETWFASFGVAARTVAAEVCRPICGSWRPMGSLRSRLTHVIEGGTSGGIAKNGSRKKRHGRRARQSRRGSSARGRRNEFDLWRQHSAPRDQERFVR